MINLSLVSRHFHCIVWRLTAINYQLRLLQPHLAEQQSCLKDIIFSVIFRSLFLQFFLLRSISTEMTVGSLWQVKHVKSVVIQRFESLVLCLRHLYEVCIDYYARLLEWLLCGLLSQTLLSQTLLTTGQACEKVMSCEECAVKEASHLSISLESGR